MATYKVIQDIEAEDHILGPLSLRQFIFALIAALCFYLCYIVTTKGAAFLIVLFLPPGLFCAFFAAPFGKDQPTEIWALAKIRFFFKPRRRIWDQSGVKDLVTITVPKKVEVRRTDGLSQNEVKSRLTALANTIDSRGWAVKDVDVNLYTRASIFPSDGNSDRLVDMGSLPQPVPMEVVNPADDILDADSNPIAQQFDQMINASTQAHHQQLVAMLQHEDDGGAVLRAPLSPTPATSSDWFLQQATPPVPTGPAQSAQSSNPASPPTPVSQPAAVEDDTAVTKQLRANSEANAVVYENMKKIQPLGQQAQSASAAATLPKEPSLATAQMAKNNDLNISTIARVVNKKDLPSDEEVIIPLH